MLKWITGGNTMTNEEAENKLLSEKWHIYSSYADLDKIKTRIISSKYFIEQQNDIEYYCPESEINYLLTKPDGLKSERMKRNIRNGIPIKHTRQIILKLFNVDLNSDQQLKENYKTRFVSIFKNRDPKSLGDNVPFLSYHDTLDQNIGTHFLNHIGLEVVKELLWLLYSVVPNIEFCPFLIKIISFCLIFLNKYEVFAITKNMIINDYSIPKEEINTLRFRLRFNYEENKRLIPSFLESFKTISNTGKEVSQKFEKLGLDFDLLVEEMFYSLFVDYFNFMVYQKVVLLYLREGVKILYRIGYSIFKAFKKELLEADSADQIRPILKNKCLDLKDTATFFSNVYYYKLNHLNNRFDQIKVLESFKGTRKNFYIPTFNGESNIMKDNDIFNLWTIFPDNFKSKDAKLIYSSDYHEPSLSKIYEVCGDSDNSCFNCFILIQSGNKNIFGLIMSIPFDKSRVGYYKPIYTSLFVLNPFLMRYDVMKNTDKMILCEDDKVIIGNGDKGPALVIDKDLDLGFSYKSDIFGSPSLAALTESTEDEVSFKIDKLEVFILY